MLGVACADPDSDNNNTNRNNNNSEIIEVLTIVRIMIEVLYLL